MNDIPFYEDPDRTPATTLEAACKYLGWQGGTAHDARKALMQREEAMIRQMNMMDDESGAPEVIISLEREIAFAQTLIMELPR